MPGQRTWMAAATGLVALIVGLGAGCSSTSKASPPTSVGAQAAASTTPHGSGSVSVLYAGSLVDLMEKQVAPGFKAATGYTFDGFSAGSTALASQIKGKVRQGDVFISASPSVNDSLEGPDHGGWVSWYATFASSPLVLGFNPSSKFASDLKTKPWYQVLAEPGILVGRTDPATDPKGKLTVTALTAASEQYHEPALGSLAGSGSNVYPEETLVGRLQAGQLDAGFFYSSEATAASVPTVPVTVPGQSLKATYTVTILAHAPDEAGAEAFVAYLLGSDGRSALQKDGFTVLQPPAVTGTGVPSSLHSVLASS